MQLIIRDLIYRSPHKQNRFCKNRKNVKSEKKADADIVGKLLERHFLHFEARCQVLTAVIPMQQPDGTELATAGSFMTVATTVPHGCLRSITQTFKK